MLWLVHYENRDHLFLCIQVEAETLTQARAEALPLVGTRGRIIRIERFYNPAPYSDPANRKVQGT